MRCVYNIYKLFSQNKKIIYFFILINLSLKNRRIQFFFFFSTKKLNSFEKDFEKSISITNHAVPVDRKRVNVYETGSFVIVCQLRVEEVE